MEKIHPFSNGTEFMMWRDVNCSVCAKDCPFDDETGYGEPLCDIETALAFAAVDDGMVNKDIADRANLPFVGTIEKCSEFVEK